jgi:peptidoglycan/LPS O-acetylase OafA/YrhL
MIIPFVIIVAWLILRYFDEPVRARLTRRYGIKRATVKIPGEAGEAQ